MPGTFRDCVIVGERGALVADYGSSTLSLYTGAHALRGCVANFCATPAFEVASELQNLATAENLGAAPAALAKLEAEVKRLTEALRALVAELQA